MSRILCLAHSGRGIITTTVRCVGYKIQGISGLVLKDVREGQHINLERLEYQ